MSRPRGEEAEAGRCWRSAAGGDPAAGAAAEHLRSAQGGRGYRSVGRSPHSERRAETDWRRPVRRLGRPAGSPAETRGAALKATAGRVVVVRSAGAAAAGRPAGRPGGGAVGDDGGGEAEGDRRRGRGRGEGAPHLLPARPAVRPAGVQQRTAVTRGAVPQTAVAGVQEGSGDAFAQFVIPRVPDLEVVCHLHFYNILTLRHIIESDEDARPWLVSQLKALCGWTPARGGEETKKMLSTVVGVLVGSGFELSPRPAAADRKAQLLCCSALDDLLFWLLDTVERSPMPPCAAAELWLEVFDASLCGVSASGETLQRFFTHSLTQTLTYKPQLTVSDAVALQNEWTFAKSNALLTSLFRKLAVVFGVEQLLRHLRQVLETREVNWKHVLCFLSTLLVCNPGAQLRLRELLSGLLSSAFEGYDLESMITAFLLARQGALEGPAVFPSYGSWFKMSFGGGGGPHAASKKSLVFLLKFLSDLVPFEPPQYLKVHILQSPYVPVKHRSLLMEYVSLAKTRLADLKEPVEDMGLYEDVSGEGAASLQGQAVQDVEKAVSLFESTGRISATVMEASIFRRPYFLTRFLPALLRPRTLPVQADARTSFIEALRKADKVPAAQYSQYVESCQKRRHEDAGAACSDTDDEPVEALSVQLQELTQLLDEASEGELSARLSRIAHALSAVFPGGPVELPGRRATVVDVILRSFCQCVINASRAKPPNKQSSWASMFVGTLLGNAELLSALVHRLRDLFRNQASSLGAAHQLGLAALAVHLHAGAPRGPPVRLLGPVRVDEALSSALACGTRAGMLFCVRLCVAALSYGICRGDAVPPEQRQDYVLSGFYKKLLYLIPRLSPETRASPVAAGGPRGQEPPPGPWLGAAAGATWREAAGSLWRHPAFRQLQREPQYQLPLSEWLAAELSVQRGDDALSDPERQEYQQWACWELYLPRPEEQGGCGGDTRILCSHLLRAVMDQQLSSRSVETQDVRVSVTGTCLPDILSRLQELVYEMQVTDLRHGTGRPGVCDLLLESASRRCASSAPAGVSAELGLQRALDAWNRVVLALPAALLVKVKPDGGGATLEVDALVEHVNRLQRRACSPVGLLSCHLTSHFLRGLLCAGARCGRPGEEVNNAWSQISVCCPLLLVSAAHWWERLSPVLSSLWRRLCDGELLPAQLQLLEDCRTWACRLEKGQLLPAAPAAAAALLLAASLHRAWRGSVSGGRGLSELHRQVLVFLLFLCVKDHLSSLLDPQEETPRGAASAALCSDLLLALVDCADWLLLFHPSERGVYQPIAAVMSDQFARLMPWAFYSLLLRQSAELRRRAARSPGFLRTAVPCYAGLLRLFLEGGVAEPPQVSEPRLFIFYFFGAGRRWGEKNAEFVFSGGAFRDSEPRQTVSPGSDPADAAGRRVLQWTQGAGVPVLRPGPRGGSGSLHAPPAREPQPRDGLPLTDAKTPDLLTCTLVVLTRPPPRNGTKYCFVKRIPTFYLYVFFYIMHTGHMNIRSPFSANSNVTQ
ncbi:Fanconi anemia group A protein homolog isoform X3 [Gasterosteus aculeatus]